jgi:hypothetical protein
MRFILIVLKLKFAIAIILAGIHFSKIIMAIYKLIGFLTILSFAVDNLLYNSSGTFV